MPEFNVFVSADGVGSIKVRSDSAVLAREDAAQMSIEDINFDSFTITVLGVDGEDDDATTWHK